MSGSTVGILGGGQLGRMLALAGVPLGVRVFAVEPAPDAPAAAIAEIIAAPFDDRRALEALARRCDVVTVELEAVPVDALAWLAERVPVHPNPAAVAVAQDRLAEKRRFRALGIDTAPFDEAIAGEVLVKARRGGFDGRGQRRASDADGIARATAELGGDVIVEGLVPFERELAVLGARGRDGVMRIWPVVDTVHVDGILRTARPSGRRQDEAEAIVGALAGALDYVGVLAVELFDTAGGLVANEWAPRVHNSGHWTIEGSTTSQFEQHLRAILGWPLGDPSAREESAMANLVGTVPDPTAVLGVPGAHLHLYDKVPRPGRKLGHITVTAPDPVTVDDRLAAVDGIILG